MAFTDTQRKSLSAKLKHRFVRTRTVHGAKLSYVEGWHVIAEANRIFGYDSWDRRTLSPRCVWAESREGRQTEVLYTTTVRITVRAGGELVMRDGIGTGFGRANSPETAHETALKAAETDATKRALATFGNPFGLALYDKEQLGVTRAPRPTRKALTEEHVGRAPVSPVTRKVSLTLRSATGRSAFASAEEFMRALLVAVEDIDELVELYAFWEANRAALKILKAVHPDGESQVETIIEALRARARALGRVPAIEGQPEDNAARTDPTPALAFPKEKRLRNKDHLRFVAQQPCLVCGRQPSHAHHVRFAQHGALGARTGAW